MCWRSKEPCYLFPDGEISCAHVKYGLQFPTPSLSFFLSPPQRSGEGTRGPLRAERGGCCKGGSKSRLINWHRVENFWMWSNARREIKRERERERSPVPSYLRSINLRSAAATGIPPRWNLRGGRDPRSALRIYSRIPLRGGGGGKNKRGGIRTNDLQGKNALRPWSIA